MGRACSTYQGDVKCMKKFWLDSLNGKGHAKDLGIDGRIKLNRS
jgi:hypothetical protein